MVQGETGVSLNLDFSEIEPYIPEEGGDLAKSLVQGDPVEAVKVVSVDEDKEEVEIAAENGEKKIVPLDKLCKIQRKID